ncbi:MAG: methionine--tRNA ligase [Candidatus Kapabacteria bacterium]|nr:methionine--tRNA ligase [Candidatus Kapabacteria bacterium]MDW8012291.1 methionine--tRNA ligase [Bacteroidota bacterium]
MERVLITAALPYANGYIHLGHCAGAYLPADLYARYSRLRGREVLFICGSDEHGAPITIAAEQQNVSPQQLVDHYHRENALAFERLGMSFDYYGRTTDPLHVEFAQQFFLALLRKGYLEPREEEQFYDPEAGLFLPDRYVEGTCPYCGYEAARGDQCDQCGAYYNQLELRNPRSRITGKPPVVRRTRHWYFLLSRFQNALEEYIERHQHDWKENVLQQTRSWLRRGLSDRPITRDLEWGVPVPLPEAQGKVLYVWFEALLGYISITHRWAQERGQPELWRLWWTDLGTRYVAFIGKDNIVFHTLMFPAMLMAHGGYILPDNVPANEFLNLEGAKFSKSRNWSVDVRDFLRDFPEEHSVDALRYALAMNLPETRDSEFTWSDFASRTNNELVAAFGNFVHRTLQFVHRYWGGQVPELVSDEKEELLAEWRSLADAAWRGQLLEFSDRWRREERFLLQELCGRVVQAAQHYDYFRFRDAVAEAMGLARAANKFFNDMAPWRTIVEEPATCARTLFFCIQLVRSLAILFAPVVPFAARRLWHLLQLPARIGDVSESESRADLWLSAVYPEVPQGHLLAEPRLLFAKFPEQRIALQRQKLGSPPSSGQEMPLQTQDSYATLETLQRLGLRIGKVVAAERIAGTDRLLLLRVDIGGEERRIVAGIAQQYSPEQLLGRAIVVATNLKPAVIRGIESQGILLAATASDGTPVLLVPERDVPSGAEVR